MAKTEQTETIINNFAQICVRLSKIIDKRSVISANDLQNFTWFVIFSLQNNISLKSKAFDQLFWDIRNYWLYQLASDKNLYRCCSYIQLYQMLVILNTSDKQKDDEEYVSDLLTEHSQDQNVINLIKQSPGITFKKLREESNYNVDVLSEQLNHLESNRFIASRRNGDFKYYALTHLGDILYQKLKTKNV